MTSPPLIDPSWIHVKGLIEFFMKRTEPSPKSVLTPPGCRLRAPTNEAPRQTLVVACRSLERAGCRRARRYLRPAALAGLVPGPELPKSGRLSMLSPTRLAAGIADFQGRISRNIILVAVGREPRHVRTCAREKSVQMVPRTSSDAPWRISDTKCVLLVPSVIEANETDAGPVPALLMPNGDAR